MPMTITEMLLLNNIEGFTSQIDHDDPAQVAFLNQINAIIEGIDKPDLQESAATVINALQAIKDGQP